MIIIIKVPELNGKLRRDSIASDDKQLQISEMQYRSRESSTCDSGCTLTDRQYTRKVGARERGWPSQYQ